MKKVNTLLYLVCGLLIFTACSEDDNDIEKSPEVENVNSEEPADASPAEEKPIEKDEPEETPVATVLEIKQAKNIPAPQTGGRGAPVGGEFTKFDLEKGEVTVDEDTWDIAFRSTTIAVNGGEATGTNDEPDRKSNASIAIVNKEFSEVLTASELTFIQDSSKTSFAIPTGSDSGWYNYAGPPTHLIAPLAGKTFVVKTSEGNYAKIEFLSYYKDGDTKNDSRYYSFNYALNTTQNDNSLKTK